LSSHAASRNAPLAALRHPAVLIVVAVTLVCAAIAHFAPADTLPRVLPTEDAFYALSVSRHVAIGDGITADGLTSTNGFQPLWVALNVPLYAIAGGDRYLGLRLSQWLGTLLFLAFVVLIALLARALVRRHGGEGTIAAAAAAIVAAGSVSIFRLFQNGLETGVTLVCLAGAVLVLDRWERWTPRRVVLAGLLLGALVWARLDEVMFVVAFAAVSVIRVRHQLRRAVGPLAACALAALLLAPWLAWNIHLDGSPMPSSGKAEAAGVDAVRNAGAALRAVGAWAAPPLLRPSLHDDAMILSYVGAVVAILLTLGAARYVLRRRREPLGSGTVALVAFCGFLLAWYILKFGPWWFLERYLSPLLLLTIPFLTSALELSRPRPRALAVLAGVVLVANVPLFVVLASGPSWPPPAWAARESNLGTHTNLNYEEQYAWVRAHVRPQCVVGAYETGTLLYFRDHTVNLDGKVDHAALQARLSGKGPEYVDQRHVDVMMDISSGIDRGLKGHLDQWRLVEAQWRYEAYVRQSRESACLIG
jgi:uncharacterized membrane protein YeaQ/YmgE (transglycosylase-associated protein family)